MVEPGRTDPFSDVISLVAGPIAAVIRSFDQLRKGADELMRGFENFNSTMENLNETAGRVNRLLNDFEEPIRAMVPQITRTVKMADDLSNRLATPIDQVIPGLSRLADTLNSPVLRSMPTDLGTFMDVINDLSRRMSPLAALAEQAGGMFGLRIPGRGPRPAPTAPAPAPPAPTPAPVTSVAAAPTPVEKAAVVTRAATAKKVAAKKAAPRKTPAKKRAPTKTSAKKTSVAPR
ncbi:MAG: hypothetical protein ABW328_19750 [Ilumatobacteraceae bacterium]